MGDVVFAPVYEVLRERGVRFEFFSAVQRLGLAPDAARVDEIEIARQAELAPGLDSYDPLVDVKGLPCWPSEPRWEQLRDGARLAAEAPDFERELNPLGGPVRTLRHGTDFDEVVLGIPVGALRRPVRRADRARRALPARHRDRGDRADPGLPALVGPQRRGAGLGARRELGGRLLRGAARHLLRHDPPDPARVLGRARRGADDRLLLRGDRRPRGREPGGDGGARRPRRGRVHRARPGHALARRRARRRVRLGRADRPRGAQRAGALRGAVLARERGRLGALRAHPGRLGRAPAAVGRLGLREPLPGRGLDEQRHRRRLRGGRGDLGHGRRPRAQRLAPADPRSEHQLDPAREPGAAGLRGVRRPRHRARALLLRGRPAHRTAARGRRRAHRRAGGAHVQRARGQRDRVPRAGRAGAAAGGRASTA